MSTTRPGSDHQPRTLWITGASGGLTKATAEAFHRAGWIVIAGARSFADASPAPRLHHLQLDVTAPDSCLRFEQAALRISPRVDLLICGAAILVMGSCELTADEEYRRVMEVCFHGTTRMVSLALPHMRRAGSGRIMLFSSINGLLGIPFQSAYTAAKHALEGYAECLAMEAHAQGVGVCLIEPGDHRGGSDHTRMIASAEDGASPYHDACRAAVSAIRRDEATGLCPDRLARKVLRNATRRRMRFRLRVAKPDQHLAVWLHTLLPARLNSLILRRYYGG